MPTSIPESWRAAIGRPRFSLVVFDKGGTLIDFRAMWCDWAIEIARQLLKDTHSITQLLVRMEKRGLIRRVKDLPRKNMIRVVMTPKGNKAFKQTSGTKTIPEIMSVLTADEKKQLEDTLNKLRDKATRLLKGF